MATVQKITPHLWFDHQAEEAAEFYTSVFRDAKMGRISRYGKEGFEIHGRPAGSAMTVEFTLEGQQFLALNGGPVFKFNESISFMVHCDNQEEIDHYWDKLSEGGDPKAQRCGWLKDKFGLSWQVAPSILGKLMSDPQRGQQVMQAFMQMKKMDIAALEAAYHRQPTGAGVRPQ